VAAGAGAAAASAPVQRSGGIMPGSSGRLVATLSGGRRSSRIAAMAVVTVGQPMAPGGWHG
jgi:hypothetical protein